MKYVVPIPFKNWGNKIEAKDLKELFLKYLYQLILAVKKGSDNFCKVIRVEFNLTNDCKIRKISKILADFKIQSFSCQSNNISLKMP